MLFVVLGALDRLSSRHETLRIPTAIFTEDSECFGPRNEAPKAILRRRKELSDWSLTKANREVLDVSGCGRKCPGYTAYLMGFCCEQNITEEVSSAASSGVSLIVDLPTEAVTKQACGPLTLSEFVSFEPLQVHVQPVAFIPPPRRR